MGEASAPAMAREALVLDVVRVRARLLDTSTLGDVEEEEVPALASMASMAVAVTVAAGVDMLCVGGKRRVSGRCWTAAITQHAAS